MEQTSETKSPGEYLADIEASIGLAKGAAKKALTNRKSFYFIASVASLFLLLHYSGIVPLNLFVTIIIWTIDIFFIFAGLGTTTEKFDSEIDRLQSLKKIYFGDFDRGPDTNYFDSLVRINIQNLGDYYRIVKVHSKESFQLAAAAGTVGFILVVAGMAIGFLRQEWQYVSYISSASGVIMEMISGVFFYLYNKTVRQLKGYHDSLLDVQNILLSFKLIETTSDEKEKSLMIQKMIEFLVGKERATPSALS